jgi:hypothetical protein
MARRRGKPVHSTAPIADGREDLLDAPASGVLLRPPTPLATRSQPPLFRPLKVYRFGPSRGRSRGNIQTVDVHYEKLAPGPVGERISVVDYDASRKCFYDPVDLDDPHIAINGGLDPSESDPHFHQQMVYAVASESLRNIEVALGRAVRERSPQGTKALKVIIHPHYSQIGNAHSESGRMMFGYFQAGAKARGRVLPGQTVFTCLSSDVVGHEMTHIVLNAMRPDLDYSALDTGALVETLADLTPMLFHFTNREIVFDTVQRTAGIIYQSQLEGSANAESQPRIVAELDSDNPLLALSGEFGDALGNPGGIRNALLSPDPAAFAKADEHHARGAIVVAAVFDAMFSIYAQRTADLFRIYRAGGGRIQGNDLPEPLAVRLCEEVETIATRFFGMCWRAIDYCPPIVTSLSDFLRACITADYDYARDDTWAVRDCLMQAFRTRGILPKEAAFFSEDAMRWPVADAHWPLLNPDRLTDDALEELAVFANAGRKPLRIRGADAARIYPLQTARFASPTDLPQITMNTQILTGEQAGVTIVFDSSGRVRYAIPTSKIPGK